MRKLQLAYIMAKIHAIGIETGCDPTIIAALGTIESNLDPAAVGDNLQSHGIGQFHMKGAGAGLNPTDLHHIDYSIRRMCAHVLDLMSQVNYSLEDMASAYNQGINGWKKYGRSTNQLYIDLFLAQYNKFHDRTPLEWATVYLLEALGDD